jgi:hypothetical protein
MRATEDLLSVERPVIAQLPDIDKRDFLSSRAAESGLGS